MFVCWCTTVALILTLRAAAKDHGIYCLVRAHCKLLATVYYSIQWESSHAFIHGELLRNVAIRQVSYCMQETSRPFWDHENRMDPVQHRSDDENPLSDYLFPLFGRCSSRVWWKAQKKTRRPFASSIMILAKIRPVWFVGSSRSPNWREDKKRKTSILLLY